MPHALVLALIFPLLALGLSGHQKPAHAKEAARRW